MKLFSDIAIQQYLKLRGMDLGSSGIDGVLGDKGSDTYSRRAIDIINQLAGMPADGGVWGEGCQKFAENELTKGIQLTENFNSSEFGCGLCPGDSDYPYHDEDCNHWPDMINTEAIRLLQLVRNDCGALVVTSGLRCQTFNDSLPGSVPYSAHRLGRAFDVYGIEANLQYIYDKALEVGFGYNSYIGNGYVHCQYDGDKY